jgi:hypothetical protein
VPWVPTFVAPDGFAIPWSPLRLFYKVNVEHSLIKRGTRVIFNHKFTIRNPSSLAGGVYIYFYIKFYITNTITNLLLYSPHVVAPC